MNALTKTIATVVLGTAVFVVAAVWLVIPSLKKVEQLNKNLQTQKSQISQLQNQILAYQTAESDLNKATDKQRIFDAILPKEELVGVIKQTESSIAKSGATESGLSISDPFLAAAAGKPKSKQKAPPAIIPGLNSVVAVPYQLSVAGDYASVVDLFSYLEHLPNFTEIDSFHMTAETASVGQNPDDKPSPHTGQINVNINAVYFAKKDATAKN